MTPPRLATAFLAWGSLPVLLAAIGLATGPLHALELLGAGFALLWIGAGVALLRGAAGAPWLALALVAVPWTLALVQATRRLLFVLHEGDLERADGYGSPMAFVLGATVEVLFFLVPLTVLGVLLWRATPRAEARRDA